MITSILSILFIYTGIIFIVIAAIGMIRMPDVYTRMSAATKAVTFGTGFILFGVLIHFNDTIVFLKIAAIFIFLLFSLSVAAHVIGLAAYNDQTKMTKLTFLDELKKYISPDNAPEKVDDPDEKSDDNELTKGP